MAGLTYRQFIQDRQKNDIDILRRGVNGNTIIDVRSIRRPDRRAAIEAKFGPIE